MGTIFAQGDSFETPLNKWKVYFPFTIFPILSLWIEQYKFLTSFRSVWCVNPIPAYGEKNKFAHVINVLFKISKRLKRLLLGQRSFVECYKLQACIQQRWKGKNCRYSKHVVPFKKSRKSNDSEKSNRFPAGNVVAGPDIKYIWSVKNYLFRNKKKKW